MKDTLTQLQERYDLLAAKFQRLSTSLIDCAESLISGLPPADRLVSDMATVNDDFASLTADVRGLAAMTRITPQSAVSSLAEIRTLLDEIAIYCDLVEQHRAKSILLLQKVLRLAHRQQPDFTPLTDIQSLAAEKLRHLHYSDFDQAIGLIDPESNNNPFVALVRIVEQSDVMDADLWFSLLEVVRVAFGSDFARAVSRDRIVTGEDAPQAPAVQAEAADVADPEPVTTAIESMHENGLDRSSAEEVASPDLGFHPYQ